MYLSMNLFVIVSSGLPIRDTGCLIILVMLHVNMIKYLLISISYLNSYNCLKQFRYSFV